MTDIADDRIRSADEQIVQEIIATLAAAPRGGLLLKGPTGSGKTRKIKLMLASPGLWRTYTRVIVLYDSHRTGREYTEVIRRLPDHVRPSVIILEARPRRRCGALDREYHRLETTGCSPLARQELCGQCPHRSRCTWRKQSDPAALAAASIIMGTVDYLWLYPHLLDQAGPDTLFVIDEGRLVGRSARMVIRRGHVVMLREAGSAAVSHDAALDGNDRLAILQLRHVADHLLKRKALSRLPGIPVLDHRLAAAVQKAGRDLYDHEYHHVAAAIAGIPTAEVSWYDRSSGDIGYVQAIGLADHRYLIASATLPLVLAQAKFRDPNLEVIPDPVEVHPGTRIYNIASSIGTKKNFPGNEARILNFCCQQAAQSGRNCC